MIRISFYRPRIFTRKFWRHWKQRRKQGFLDEETYNLYNPIAKFVLPRLRCFRKHAFGEPPSDWCQIVDKMIWSMNEIVEHDGWWQPPESPISCDEEEKERKKYYAKLQEGLTLFGKNFRGLWW